MLDSLFNKAAGLKACNNIKKKLKHSYTPVKFAKFLRTSILRNICERLLLAILNLWIISMSKQSIQKSKGE